MDERTHPTTKAPRGGGPRLGIGMPVYNGENYLAAALDSLLAQTFTDFELVISDNASTDRTEEIGRAYAARDPRVRYVRSDRNRGASWNFNRAFELCRGEYFKWAAHDDVYTPTFLKRCVKVLDQNLDVVWCNSRRGDVDPEGNVLPADAALSGAVGPEADAVAARLAAAQGTRDQFREVLLSHGARFDIYGVGRREALARTGLHRDYYGADQVFLLELSLLGRWIEIQETLFHMRRHPGQSAWIGSMTEKEAWILGRRPSRFRAPRQVRFALAFLRIALLAPGTLRDRIGRCGDWVRLVLRPRRWRGLVTEWLLRRRAKAFTEFQPANSADTGTIGAAN